MTNLAKSDRLFFSSAGVWFAVLTLVGFSPSFYFRTLPGSLPTNQILHGVVYSAWVLTFLAQAILIATNRVRWHMALGAASVGLLVIMIPVGFHVVLAKAAAGEKTVDAAGFNLTELTFGFVLALAGIWRRRKPFVHKRLMTFATLMLTVAAADRVSLILGLEEVRLFRKLLAAFPGLALFAYDGLFLRRLPILSGSLLAAVWLVIWFVISDLVFMRSAGETIIQWLMAIFVW